MRCPPRHASRRDLTDQDGCPLRRGRKVMRSGLLLLLALAIQAGEALTLPWHLADHAVLQRDRPLRLAGRAAPGAAVAVTIAGARAEAVAGVDGAWQVVMPALAAGGPHVLEATAGTERCRVVDLLVGDVWLCSGQSNMGWAVKGLPDATARFKQLDGSRLRLLKLRARIADEAQATAADSLWSPAGPEAVAGFSAVAIAFAANLRAGGLDVPIGLVQSNRAGTFAEAWMPGAAVAAMPGGADIIARWTWLQAERSRLVTVYETEHAAWERAHGERFAQWKRHPVDGPFQPHEPAAPPAADSPLRPGVLWNGQIAPLTGMALRGVLWYQGESNSDRAWHYRVVLAHLVAAWRAAWNDPALPFIVAQLPEYETSSCPYDWQDQGAWEVLRESQTRVGAEVPGVAVVPMLGLGERLDIHPRAKWEVGERLARAALATVHGRDLAWSGPRPIACRREGDRLVLTLADVGNGVATLAGGPPLGFTIAVADRRFVPGSAEILGPDRIAVRAAGIAEPVAVRYAWDDYPAFNVVCSAGLVMGPWRSDDWPVPTQDVVVPFSRTWPPDR